MVLMRAGRSCDQRESQTDIDLVWLTEGVLMLAVELKVAGKVRAVGGKRTSYLHRFPARPVHLLRRRHLQARRVQSRCPVVYERLRGLDRWHVQDCSMLWEHALHHPGQMIEPSRPCRTDLRRSDHSLQVMPRQLTQKTGR